MEAAGKRHWHALTDRECGRETRAQRRAHHKTSRLYILRHCTHARKKIAVGVYNLKTMRE